MQIDSDIFECLHKHAFKCHVFCRTKKRNVVWAFDCSLKVTAAFDWTCVFVIVGGTACHWVVLLHLCLLVLRGLFYGNEAVKWADCTLCFQDVVNSHAGLAFLKDAPDFHSRYITTVRCQNTIYSTLLLQHCKLWHIKMALHWLHSAHALFSW